MLYGLALGLILVGIGVATAVLAPRIGPNPIFGFRIGYAYATREVWDDTNRRGGFLFALVGALTAAAGMATSWLAMPVPVSTTMVTTVLIAGVLVITGWMFLYSRQMALGTATAKQYQKLPFRWIYLAPVAITAAPLVIAVVVMYPALPNRVATHFDLYSRADGWSSPMAFLLSYLGLALFPLALNLLAVVVATREPLIVFGRWGNRWTLEPERGLVFTGIALALTNLLLFLVLLNVLSFNFSSSFLFPFLSLLWLVIPFLLGIVGLFFILARREPAP